VSTAVGPCPVLPNAEVCNIFASRECPICAPRVPTQVARIRPCRGDVHGRDSTFATKPTMLHVLLGPPMAAWSA
jgi:hypothetical protein